MKVKLYQSSMFFGKDFPFAVRHVHNKTEVFNRKVRFQREFWKIAFVVNGSGSIVIRDQDYQISPGSLMLIHPNAETTYDMLSGELEIWNILFAREFIEPELSGMQDRYDFYSVFSPLFDTNAEPRPYIQTASPESGKLVRKIADEYENQYPGFHELLKFHLLELLILMMREALHQMHRHGEAAQYVHRYLEHHYAENISVPMLAHEVGMTPNHLSTLYKQRFSCGIIENLKQIRLQAAMSELKNSDRTISQICLDSGFNDMSYFYRAFSACYQCTPGDIRKKGTCDQ